MLKKNTELGRFDARDGREAKKIRRKEGGEGGRREGNKEGRQIGR